MKNILTSGVGGVYEITILQTPKNPKVSTKNMRITLLP